MPMKNNQNEKINKEGFTLFIAVIVTSLLLAIGLSISSIILKQLLLSSNGQNSQYAFYAADAATECALFWSSNATTTSGGSAFPTSSQSYLDVDYLSPNEISCNGYLGVPAVSSALTSSDINQATTSFYMAISPTTCALVTVYRSAGKIGRAHV